jgi:hypothetical protein
MSVLNRNARPPWHREYADLLAFIKGLSQSEHEAHRTYD